MISVRDLDVRYGKVHALDRVSLDIRENEIFGITGHNGAGKTTLLECMEGLRNKYGGTVSVMGMDPQKDRKKLYRHIGVQLQETVYQDRIRVFEIGKLFQSFYDDPEDFDELLYRFGLLEKKKAFVGKLSGGQKQRLSIILALVGRPSVIFLDEITTGLDPVSRREIWRIINGLKQDGMTIVLSTHYMDEAEQLCDRIAVMNKGRIAACGTLKELTAAFYVKDNGERTTGSRLEEVFFKLTGKEVTE